MGWLKKAVILLLGLGFIGSGLFLFGVVCIGYLILTLRPGRKNKSPSRGAPPLPARYLAAGFLAVLCLAAFASGGTFSPIFFGILAILLAAWPHLPLNIFTSKVVPVKGTILLRSEFLPFVWHSIAEIKPGAEDLARALSSFEGRLLIMKRGVLYAHTKTTALSAGAAEEKITREFGRMAGSVMPGGAYLLPLDSEESSQAFRTRLRPLQTGGDSLIGPTPDLIVLDASRGFVSRSGHFASVQGSTGTTIPEGTRPLRTPPLTWEALERLGKKLRWPEPDSLSNLLQSVHASRNEPLAERLAGLESSGDKVTVQALAGDKVELSRAQLRAMVSIYS
jgi:hypothetical protein